MIIPRRYRFRVFYATAALWCFAPIAHAAEKTPASVDFNHDIRPIFAKHCLSCHGPETAEASLRLDRREAALRGGNSGPAYVPGKSAQSRLVDYVAGTGKDETIMPPEGERLSTTEVALIKSWIDQGARWPDEPKPTERQSQHWSFQPLKAATPPSVAYVKAVRNPIDAFVLARLEAEGIEPSPEADRATLIRRLSLDLLGLPPEPADVDEFVRDTRPDAYERLVDRLLASPHYGERFARHWLDLARYADSDGYEKDTGRPHAWRYRNWVIDALSRDLPFDQFTIQQLAGDLLPGAGTEERVATGFHRNTLTNREGGVDREEFRVAATVDRVNTTGAVWLGLTVGCAQCHTHKYDPIAQREYYGLFAFFNGLNEVDVPAAYPDQIAAYKTALAKHQSEHRPLVEALARYEKELARHEAAWQADRQQVNPTKWSDARLESATASGGASIEGLPDGSLRTKRAKGAGGSYVLKLGSELATVRAIRLEVLGRENVKTAAADRSFSLGEISVSVAPADPKHPQARRAAKRLVLQNAVADAASGTATGIAQALDNDAKTGWSADAAKDHAALLETVDYPTFDGGTLVTITLAEQARGPGPLGRFRISLSDSPGPLTSGGLAHPAAKILEKPSEKRTAAERATLAAYYRTQDPEWRKLSAAVAAHAKRVPADPAGTYKAQAVAEMPGGRPTHTLVRGDFLRPGAAVEPHTLDVLPPLVARAAKADRLDLARWLVGPHNPLTPRVLVNRLWAWHFGRGLVATVDDFGTQGERPSHPELLDWLAGEVMRRGWSLKQMHKLIVSSATYRQSSASRADLAERDPMNRLLARQQRLRVEAEIIRDVSLSASGLLCPSVGGPSVRPRQPVGISELTYAGAARWVESHGDDRHRRGLYTWFQRTSPYPMLMTFDAPDSNVTCARRERSNTPLQALTLLNDPVFFECAQALGRRIVTEAEAADAPAGRVDLAFRLCLGRSPTASERASALQLFDEQLAFCRADERAAAELVGGEPRPKETSTAELAAWVVVGRTLMNLDEFITRE